MSDVRALFRPNRDLPFDAGQGLPRGESKASREARATLAAHLDASLPRPLWATDAGRDVQINTALQTLTVPERIFIELEARAHDSERHSYDYDPLR